MVAAGGGTGVESVGCGGLGISEDVGIPEKTGVFRGGTTVFGFVGAGCPVDVSIGRWGGVCPVDPGSRVGPSGGELKLVSSGAGLPV